MALSKENGWVWLIGIVVGIATIRACVDEPRDDYISPDPAQVELDRYFDTLNDNYESDSVQEDTEPTEVEEQVDQDDDYNDFSVDDPSDFDCEDIGGEVWVGDDDPNGLDRDGDGWACEGW